jgi:hypothetical protein
MPIIPFDPDQCQIIDAEEGTIKFVYKGGSRLAKPPSARTVLAEGVGTRGTVAHFDVDEEMNLHFVRMGSDGLRDVSVNISTLSGASNLLIFGVWDATETVVYAGDADKNDPPLSAAAAVN